MSRDAISIELDHSAGSVPEWEDALSRYVGQVTPALRDDEITRCIPAAAGGFRARLEYGAVGSSVLFKASASPNHFIRSLSNPGSALPSPLLLFVQLSGSHRFQQSKKPAVLRPGDWCMLDTLDRIDCWTQNERAELLGFTLARPVDPELKGLSERGFARRFDGKLGTSRVLQRTLLELFAQLNNVAPSSGSGLCNAVTTIVWDALREQLAAPPPLLYRDIQVSRLKAYIESQLSDPVLSVDAIAQGCGLSTRSVHRAFALDPAGSVSAYVWRRRLERCAEALRDEKQAQQSIASICLQWGFHNTSHFSRAFRQQFGLAPRMFRSLERSHPQ